MRMEAGLDTGPVYARREVPIDAEATTTGLTETLAIAGAEELVAVLAALERGTAAATPQPEEGVTYAARLTREDGVLDWAGPLRGGGGPDGPGPRPVARRHRRPGRRRRCASSPGGRSPEGSRPSPRSRRPHRG